MTAVHPSIVAMAARRLGAPSATGPIEAIAESECAVDIGNGLQMRLPAHPHPNTYVRLTRQSEEIGRWTPEAWDIEGDLWLQDAAATPAQPVSAAFAANPAVTTG